MTRNRYIHHSQSWVVYTCLYIVIPTVRLLHSQLVLPMPVPLWFLTRIVLNDLNIMCPSFGDDLQRSSVETMVA